MSVSVCVCVVQVFCGECVEDAHVMCALGEECAGVREKEGGEGRERGGDKQTHKLQTWCDLLQVLSSLIVFTLYAHAHNIIRKSQYVYVYVHIYLCTECRYPAVRMGKAELSIVSDGLSVCPLKKIIPTLTQLIII